MMHLSKSYNNYYMKQLLSLIFFFFLLQGFAQNPYYTVDRKEFYKFYSIGRYNLDQGNFQDAFEAFSIMDSMYPNNANVTYYLGLCKYNKPYHKIDAIPYFNKILSKISMNFKGEFLDTTAPVFTYYFLADALLADGQVDSAIVLNSKYYTNIEKYYAPAYYSDLSRDDLLKDAEKQLAVCYNAKKYISNPLRIKLLDIGHSINTNFDDYYLVLSPDSKTIIYTSRILNKTKYVENIFMVKEVDGVWSKPINMYPSSDNMVGVSLMTGGKQLIVFKRDVNNGDLFTADIVNDQLINISSLKGNVNSKELESYASISPDGKTLYFCGERKGGYGGMDIWFSQKLTNGDWDIPKNMGPMINTPDDELSPFVSFDGKTVYFSSNGHETMGGFDIFKTQLSELGVWTTPQNLGYPINTPDDNFYLAVDKDILYVYFSSLNKSSNVDLYKALILENIKQVLVKGDVVDQKSKEKLPATLYCVSSATNDTISLMTLHNGEYNLHLPVNQKFQLIIKSKDYIDISKEIFTIQDEEMILDPIEMNSIAKPVLSSIKDTLVKVGVSISSNDLIKPNVEKSKRPIIEEHIELDKIYFDFNNASFQESSKSGIEKLVGFLKRNNNVKITIVGYTDSIGGAVFNKQLATKRAKAIYDILVLKGVDAKRLTYLGVGIDNPAASNDSEEGRQLNRRVEFVIKKK